MSWRSSSLSGGKEEKCRDFNLGDVFFLWSSLVHFKGGGVIYDFYFLLLTHVQHVIIFHLLGICALLLQLCLHSIHEINFNRGGLAFPPGTVFLGSVDCTGLNHCTTC